MKHFYWVVMRKDYCGRGESVEESTFSSRRDTAITKWLTRWLMLDSKVWKRERRKGNVRCVKVRLRLVADD